MPTDGTHAGWGDPTFGKTHMDGTVVHRKLRFGPFELSIGERVLRCDGQVLPLGDRALDILIYLADRPKGRGYTFVGTVVPFAGSTGSRNDRSRRQGWLPARPLMMIDRESMISRVKDELRDGRFVTLLGPGGVGKTTIALSVGRAAAEEFGGEVYFVDLEGLADPCCGGCRDILGIYTQIERCRLGAGRPRSFEKAPYHSR